ncbi:dUTP diphosphatase [Rossellomorea aquimaris]|uniref:dUTP diphosphatase n=1 Tax=Rossellomorea aquimaris TaxID=189382 RepID=UPI001CD4ECC9|nr:dUTP diphosphatase [Rossellomorea aquimaris]MCA1056394.1 dUTP diphosphatase [Rossellomorea aquimaris]
MKIEELLHMQKDLDQHIESEHGLEDEDLVDKKILALLVEAGELANETRSFKFWSKKAPSEKSIILEEYVDGIHFILSLGLEIGLEEIDVNEQHAGGEDLNEQFLHVFKSIVEFREERSVNHFFTMFNQYLLLGEVLGFSRDDVYHAYLNKNKVNYERQKEGY